MSTRRLFPLVATEHECTCYVCGKKGTATTLYHKDHLATSVQPPAGWWVMPDELVVFAEEHEDDKLPGLMCSIDCAMQAEWSNRGVW